MIESTLRVKMDGDKGEAMSLQVVMYLSQIAPMYFAALKLGIHPKDLANSKVPSKWRGSNLKNPPQSQLFCSPLPLFLHFPCQ